MITHKIVPYWRTDNNHVYVSIEGSNMIFHSLTFARSLGKVENLGLCPPFSTLPEGPCEC